MDTKIGNKYNQKIKKRFAVIFLGAFVLALAWGVIFLTLCYPKDKLFVLSVQTQKAQANLISSHSLSPLLSNLWYSDLFFDFPSYPLYALPLAFKTEPKGLGFSYPHEN